MHGFSFCSIGERFLTAGEQKKNRRTAGSLTVQDKQGTHEQLSLNKKTQLWIIQVTTQY